MKECEEVLENIGKHLKWQYMLQTLKTMTKYDFIFLGGCKSQWPMPGIELATFVLPAPCSNQLS